jgi:hypothetical protein
MKYNLSATNERTRTAKILRLFEHGQISCRKAVDLLLELGRGAYFLYIDEDVANLEQHLRRLGYSVRTIPKGSPDQLLKRCACGNLIVDFVIQQRVTYRINEIVTFFRVTLPDQLHSCHHPTNKTPRHLHVLLVMGR